LRGDRVDDVFINNEGPHRVRKRRQKMKKFITMVALVASLAGATAISAASPAHASASAAPKVVTHEFKALNIEHAARPAGFAPRPKFAAGRTGDHVWLIVSGADVAAGVVGYNCSVALTGATFGFGAGPAAVICSVVAGIAQQGLNRFGRTSNHGVWVTVGIYWYNFGRVTGAGFY
jgi:hypothetical protein